MTHNKPPENPRLQQYWAEVNEKPDQSHLTKKDAGFMDYMDLLFSIGDPIEYERKALWYGLSPSETDPAAATYASDFWTRIAEIKQQETNRTQEDALRIFIDGMAGVAAHNSLLRADIAKAIQDDTNLKSEYDALKTQCVQEGLDPNLIANTLWNGQHFAQRPAEEFITQVSTLNAETGNTGLSILVQLTGGPSRPATEGENPQAAFTSIIDQAVIKIQQETGNTEFSAENFDPSRPAHMAVLYETMEENGHEQFVEDYFTNNAQAWPLSNRSQAINAMHAAKIDVPADALRLNESWSRASAPQETTPEPSLHNTTNERDNTPSPNVTAP